MWPAGVIRIVSHKVVLEMYLIKPAGNSLPKLPLTAYESHIDAITCRPE